MLWDVQRLIGTDALVDVRKHDAKQDRKGDAKPPFVLTVEELTIPQAVELSAKALSHGGDGFNPPKTALERITDDEIRSEYSRRKLGVAL